MMLSSSVSCMIYSTGLTISSCQLYLISYWKCLSLIIYLFFWGSRQYLKRLSLRGIRAQYSRTDFSSNQWNKCSGTHHQLIQVLVSLMLPIYLSPENLSCYQWPCTWPFLVQFCTMQCGWDIFPEKMQNVIHHWCQVFCTSNWWNKACYFHLVGRNQHCYFYCSSVRAFYFHCSDCTGSHNQ